MPFSENIHSISHTLLDRCSKESLHRSKGGVFWLFGLSGSGKSTLAIALEKTLFEQNLNCIVIDGDNLREGLNRDLGFTDEDRTENVRRASELAKILVRNGLVVVVSMITPFHDLREKARSIIGKSDFHEVYVKASYSTCRTRDVKGLYGKADSGKIQSFTGKSSSFEEPTKPWMLIDTEKQSISESIMCLKKAVFGKISLLDSDSVS